MSAVIEKPTDQRLSLIWGEKANPQMLTLLKTPNSEAAGEVRDKIRVVHGPQAFKHNHYTDDMFYRHDARAGTLTNVYGQRLIRVSEDFLVALLGGLEDEVGDAAGEIMYKCGYEWGMQDMKSFSQRVQAEFEVEMNKLAMGMMLETWWWPLQIEGWGGWRYDFRQGKQGLIFIDLFESAVAQSLGDVGKVVCYFYAGLFAAVFSVLAKRQLACIEIQCYSMGEDFCKFLISTDKRVNAAQFWRNEGATSKDIMKKLQSV
ncbi:MAG: 4-vinyl reductase [Planctomycetia bacterium]|nr:4-vinyl reductase [Planctomycetia bacterium]